MFWLSASQSSRPSRLLVLRGVIQPHGVCPFSSYPILCGLISTDARQCFARITIYWSVLHAGYLGVFTKIYRLYWAPYRSLAACFFTLSFSNRGFHLLCVDVFMPPPPWRGALSDDAVWRLSVCLSRTSGLSREQRGLGRPKLARM